MNERNDWRRRKITKYERTEVYMKCFGHCAYCGTAITIDGMQVDHVVPIAHGGPDTIQNMLPACVGCNKLKSTYTIERFRVLVQRLPLTLDRESVTYQAARRYGMVEEKSHKVTFYFEQMAHTIERGAEHEVHKP